MKNIVSLSLFTFFVFSATASETAFQKACDADLKGKYGEREDGFEYCAVLSEIKNGETVNQQAPLTLKSIEDLSEKCAAKKDGIEIYSRANTGGWAYGNKVYVTAEVYSYVLCKTKERIFVTEEKKP